jgi:hypothetical protein
LQLLSLSVFVLCKGHILTDANFFNLLRMNQLLHFIFHLCCSSTLVLACWACGSSVTCHAPEGRWESEDGQVLVFLNQGQAFWIDQFGSQSDTVPFHFQMDCSAEIPALDLSDFAKGPYVGKTLFGIIQWQSDTSFRLRSEAGSSPDVRPIEFDDQSTHQFVKR